MPFFDGADDQDYDNINISQDLDIGDDLQVSKINTKGSPDFNLGSSNTGENNISIATVTPSLGYADYQSIISCLNSTVNWKDYSSVIASKDSNVDNNKSVFSSSLVSTDNRCGFVGSSLNCSISQSSYSSILGSQDCNMDGWKDSVILGSRDSDLINTTSGLKFRGGIISSRDSNITEKESSAIIAGLNCGIDDDTTTYSGSTLNDNLNFIGGSESASLSQCAISSILGSENCKMDGYEKSCINASLNCNILNSSASVLARGIIEGSDSCDLTNSGSSGIFNCKNTEITDCNNSLALGCIDSLSNGSKIYNFNRSGLIASEGSKVGDVQVNTGENSVILGSRDCIFKEACRESGIYNSENCVLDDNIITRAVMVGCLGSIVSGGNQKMLVASDNCRLAASASRLAVGNGSTANSTTGSTDQDLVWKVQDNGAVYADSVYNSSGADYAEYFELSQETVYDSNINPDDKFEFLGYEHGLYPKDLKALGFPNGKIKKLKPGWLLQLNAEPKPKMELYDPKCPGRIRGVSSATPTVIGDSASEHWTKKFETDEYGRVKYYLDQDGNPKRKLNPDYDPEVEYTPREYRPEWTIVCLKGKIWVRCDPDILEPDISNSKYVFPGNSQGCVRPSVKAKAKSRFSKNLEKFELKSAQKIHQKNDLPSWDILDWKYLPEEEIYMVRILFD